jgi:hypothetical protein
VQDMVEVTLRVTNNIDPERDIQFPLGPIDHASRLPNFGSKMGIDATRKWAAEGFNRPWPPMLTMDTDVKAKIDTLWKNLRIAVIAHGRAGREHRRAEFAAPDLSLRAYVLKLGSRDGVFFGELLEPERRGVEPVVEAGPSAGARHRSDLLSRAVNNTSNPAEFTDRYQGLMRYYGMESEKTQTGHGNEKGDREQRHHRFKWAVAQELMLRGSLDLRAWTTTAFSSCDVRATERRA